MKQNIHAELTCNDKHARTYKYLCPLYYGNHLSKWHRSKQNKCQNQGFYVTQNKIKKVEFNNILIFARGKRQDTKAKGPGFTFHRVNANKEYIAGWIIQQRSRSNEGCGDILQAL